MQHNPTNALYCASCDGTLTTSKVKVLKATTLGTPGKGSGVVRARIVLKDVAKGSDSARALGISIPTPSSDALSLLLAIAGNRGWPIATGDVSSAFMCTPLRKRNIVAKLPMSVSSMGGEPVFLH